MALTVLIGGVRAGKSSLAVDLASRTGLPVTFIATAERSDLDMADRIERHRAGRPPDWTTIEEPRDLARALDLTPPGDAVVVDCLTLWVSNLLSGGLTSREIEDRGTACADQAVERATPTFVVTNEVGSGVHPSTELGRLYRDVLGRVNTIWSVHAVAAYLVVAGRMLPLGAVERP